MSRSAKTRRNLFSTIRPGSRALTGALLAAGLTTMAGGALAASGSAPYCEQPVAVSSALPWVTDTGSSAALGVARKTLLSASVHGLDPTSYNADDLDLRADAVLARLNTGTGQTHGELASFNQEMTSAVVCYLAQVKLGMVDPRSLHKDIDVPMQDWSPVEALQVAWQDQAVAQLLNTTHPTDTQYLQLQAALKAYRTLAEQEFAHQSIAPLPTTTLRPASRDWSVAALRNRLVFLGDMTTRELASAEQYDVGLVNEDSAAPAEGVAILPPLYDEVTETAVRRFQERHGLTADGIVGPASLDALKTPMFLRVAQIEMAMERMRWLPDLSGHKVVQVNLPEFRLNFGSDASGLDTRVVIGKSARHPTPIYVGQLKHIEFSPYWNVPWSIAKREIVPPMLRDLSRMQRLDMEVVTRDGKVHRTATPELLKLVSGGKARIRQRPGKKNALGKFKFVLPNARGIFLHDTRSVSLFDRNRRDFSHGCVRVEEPMELARLALQDNEKWDEARIERAAGSSRPVYVKPATPVTVVFTYQTVSIAANGQTRFLPDVYGYDPRTVNSVERWAGINAENVNATARHGAQGSKLASLSL